MDLMVTTQQYKELKELASKTGNKMAVHIRQAIDDYIRKEKRK
jgi:predicted DNA-binding protein